MNIKQKLENLLDEHLPAATPTQKTPYQLRLRHGKKGAYILIVTWRGFTKQRTLGTHSRSRAETLMKRIRVAIMEQEHTLTATETPTHAGGKHAELSHATAAGKRRQPTRRAAAPAPARKKKEEKLPPAMHRQPASANPDYTRPCRCYSTPYKSVQEAANELQIRPQTIVRLCVEQKYGWRYDDL